MDFLREKVIGDFTVLQVGSIAAGILVAFWLLQVIRKAVASETPNPHQLRMRCYECGWVGITSKHIPVCRKCNSKSLRPV